MVSKQNFNHVLSTGSTRDKDFSAGTKGELGIQNNTTLAGTSASAAAPHQFGLQTFNSNG